MMQLAVIQIILMMTKEVEILCQHRLMPPVHAMPLAVPTEVLHAMPAQGKLVINLSEDDTPMIHGVGLAKHSSTFHHHLT